MEATKIKSELVEVCIVKFINNIKANNTISKQLTHTTTAIDAIFGQLADLHHRFYCFGFVGSVHGSDLCGDSEFLVCDRNFLVVDASVRPLCFTVSRFPSLFVVHIVGFQFGLLWVKIFHL